MSDQTTTPENLIALARACVARWETATPEQRAAMDRASWRSFLRGEAGMGTDADELAYRIAVQAGDQAEIARLDAEAAERVRRVDAWMQEHGI